MSVPDTTGGLTTRTTTHRLQIYDVTDAGELCVDYGRVRTNATLTDARHVSARLPVECLTLFDGGEVSVAELTAEEREWIESESRIEFEEVAE